jgi:hypothetical protein
MRRLARQAVIFMLVGFGLYAVLNDLYNWANIPYLYRLTFFERAIECLPSSITGGLLYGLPVALVAWMFYRMAYFAVKG